MKHILFIANAFPESETDFKGIFIKDYLLSIKDNFNCSIYVFRLFSSRKGSFIETTPDFTIYRYSLFSSNPGRVLKWLSYPLFLFLAFKHLKQIHNQDIIHVHGALYIAGTLGILFGKKLKKPVIYTEHMGRFEQFYRHRYLQIIARGLLSKFAYITCVSSFTRSKISAIGLSERKIGIINNPVDTRLFKIDNLVAKSNTIAFVGRLDENKGIIRCLHAFKNLTSKYPDLKFLVIGNGNQHKLIEEILKKDPGLSRRVVMSGFMEKKNIAQILPSCLFLVAPSIVESFGIAVAEAMACGLPVIVGKNNGTSEFVDEEAGLKIDPSNVSELTSAMDWLLLNRHNFDPVKIRSKIADHFCFEITSRKLSELYHSFN